MPSVPFRSASRHDAEGKRYGVTSEMKGAQIFGDESTGRKSMG